MNKSDIHGLIAPRQARGRVLGGSTLDSANGVGAQRVVGFCCSDQMRDEYTVGSASKQIDIYVYWRI